MTFLRITFLTAFFSSCLMLVVGNTPGQAQMRSGEDTLIYDPHYRDSLNEYIGRRLAYRQRILNYDLARSFSYLPYLGSWYVEESGQGITYAAERLGAGAVAGFGTYRLLSSNTVRPLDVAMIVVGIGAYIYLKVSEINTVQHQVSEHNEALVERFRIYPNDIDSTSIRYPKRDGYPSWVTEPPSDRERRDARESVDKPIPSADRSVYTKPAD